MKEKELLKYWINYNDSDNKRTNLRLVAESSDKARDLFKRITKLPLSSMNSFKRMDVLKGDYSYEIIDLGGTKKSNIQVI